MRARTGVGVVLAIIGPHWAAAVRGPRPTRRSIPAEDVVRLEIETAFTHGKAT